jgi:acetyl-CoA carboxylase biotin carboxyl carrier protein
MALSYADVGEILKMIDTSSCTEVVLEIDGIKMVVRKGGQGSSPIESAAIPDASLSDSDAPKTSKPMTQATPQPIDKADAGEATTGKGDIIKSPEEPPFVITGQEVKKGDTLCLIEVMKLFTAVECTADGTVEMIFAEDGALVEFDQPLFSIT